MREFPLAQLVVHPRGARHMIDPSKLEAALDFLEMDIELNAQGLGVWLDSH
jgi:hypothetical protein